MVADASSIDRTDDPRRSVPRTDVVLADPRLVERADRLGRDRVKSVVADVQHEVRAGRLDRDDLVGAVLERLPEHASSQRPVLNATGVVLHTNLGRAPLSPQAVEAVVAASGTTDVELDLATGRRSQRGRATLAALRRAVPDAGDVHVVNNGAAALLLAAAVLAAGREVVVSRGELVEIGDGFRLPELIEAAGARLREVGTTNRTTIEDYAGALGPDTAFVLKVHPSNFVMSGFTAGVGVEALTALPVPVVVDIGSGLLAPEPLLPDEPDAATALRAGGSLVTASGDKLLGGPQAGLLLGEAGIIDRLRRHPVARALRVDKLTLAALEATLGGAPTPTRVALHADPVDLRARATGLADRLQAEGVPAEPVESDGVVGGGGAPGVLLPGSAVALSEHLAAPLRTGVTAVLGRVERGRLLLDLRCVPAERDTDLLNAVLDAARRAG
ncbi:MAG: L-seryl-tRNA(Sec) selenium transferase [Spirochaetaceae bacterium]|nr:L-seryl-tRNA(Sec) selenium transferase [Spirochaetaceae bacterium]